ncbi:MAG: PAS domain S-box protein, partial [Phormidium sp.]
MTSGFIVFFLVTVWWWFQGYQNATPEASPESKNLELQHYQQLGEKLQPNQALLAAIVKDTKTLITNLKSHVINNFSPGQNLAELGKLLGKNTAQELQESEARFRNVFDNSAVGMGLVALDGRWLKVNQSLCEITGYSESELLQTNFQKITHIDDLNTEFNYVNQLLKGETRYYQIEKRYIHKQGHIVWTLLSKSLVRNSQSEPLYFIAQIQDITQPKQAVNAVKLKYEQERLLDIIVQHIRQSLNLKEILQTTVMEIHKFLDCDRVVISRISRQNSSAEVIVESRYPNCQSLLGWKISNNLYQQPSNHKISKDRTSQVINNINQSLLEPAELQLLKNFDVQAQLTIPIWQGKSIWGWLIAHSCQTKRQWQSQEVNLLQRLKNQLEVAIYQSELHHQLQQLNANLERQVQARTLEFQQALNFEATLKRITDKVRDSFDESQILQQAVEELAKVLEVKYCETTLYNLDKTTSTTRYESTNIGGAISQLKGLNAREESTIYQQLLSGQHFAFCNLTPSDEGKHYAILA